MIPICLFSVLISAEGLMAGVAGFAKGLHLYADLGIIFGFSRGR
jgi:hypothetical protein